MTDSVAGRDSESSPSGSIEAMLRVAALADQTIPLAVAAAAELRIADVFAEPCHVEAAAAASGFDVRALTRLMRALVAAGLFSEPAPGVFALTAPSRFLLDAHPWSVRGAYALMSADVRAWARLGETLRTGAPAFERAHGRSLWEYLTGEPEARARFDRGMAELSRLESIWLLDAYDWTRFAVVVDVGGGNGAWLAALLEASQSLQGVLFDLPEALSKPAESLRQLAAAGRCVFQAGSFFDDMPAGFDAYVLKRIIYSYDDSQALRILERVRAGMRMDSRSLLIEPVRHHQRGSDYANLLDLQMLVTGGGHMRSRQEFRELLHAAHLRLKRIIPTPMAAIVEAVPE